MENPPASSPVSPDALAAGLAAEMPPVSPGIVDSLSGASGAPSKSPAGAVPGGAASASGGFFKWGKRRDGSPRNKPGVKPGQKPAATASRVVVPPAAAPAQVPEPAPASDPFLPPAQATAQAIFMLGIVAGGAEWQPRVDNSIGLNEAETMTKAWRDYYAAKGIRDIPPGVALTIALAAYTLPRAMMPQTQSRLQRLKNWFAAKYLGWKSRRAAPAAPLSTPATAS